MVRVHPDRPVNQEIDAVFIENRIKKRNELKRTDTEDIKLTRSIEFKVFPVKWVINYNFTDTRNCEVEKDSSKGNTEMCAFSRILNDPNVQVRLRQFKRERTAIGSSSEQERKVNALASGAEEGRD